MSIRYLILVLTTRCNLHCRYCYNGNVETGSDMSEAVMTRALALTASGGKPFHLQLTGGEPTLAPECIEMAAMLAQRSGLCASMAIQTNATGITPELTTLLKSHRFQVGVSMDGPPPIQERLRGRAADTLKGLHRLDSQGLSFRVTTVLTQANALCLDQLVLTLAGFAGVRGIGLDLLIKKGRAKDTPDMTYADKTVLEKGLKRMIHTLDAINARRKNPIRLRERDFILSAEKKSSSVFCHACRGESMAVLPDGRIFPCGQTSGDPMFAAGSVWKPQMDRLNSLDVCRPLNAACDQCDLRPWCPGDCPSRLYYNQGNATRICDLYRILWEIEKECRQVTVSVGHRTTGNCHEQHS